MQTVVLIAKAALFAALVVLVAFMCIWMEMFIRVTAEMPIVLDKAIAREGLLTRAAAERQIQDVSGKMDKQVTALRTDLFARVDSLEDKTFDEIDQIRRDANQQLADTRTAAAAEIAKVSTPAGAAITQAQALLPPAQHILANTSETSDLLLSCDHNVDCLANRVIPALKNVEHMAAAGERTMNAVADATPETAAAVKSTSKDLAKIVKTFSKPTSWIKSVAMSAAQILGKLFI